MRIGDILTKAKSFQDYVNVLEDCIEHLKSAEDGELEIPTDGNESGIVPPENIAHIREKLEGLRDSYQEKLDIVIEVEIEDAGFEDSGEL